MRGTSLSVEILLPVPEALLGIGLGSMRTDSADGDMPMGEAVEQSKPPIKPSAVARRASLG